MAAAVKAGEVAIYFVVQQYDDNKGDDKNITNGTNIGEHKGGEEKQWRKRGMGWECCAKV